jgi:hypothetical protein
MGMYEYVRKCISMSIYYEYVWVYMGVYEYVLV